jgi:COP9 signalosome complex subunit 3
VISKFVRRHCRQYISFADVYETQSIEKLTNALEKRREAFEKVSNLTECILKRQFILSSIMKDNNWGLAHQCLRALQQQKIQDLTRTYITLSVSDIAEKVGFTGEDANTEVEKNILEMVRV